MIFCITGNAHQPFNRLVELAIKLEAIAGCNLLVQNGACDYQSIQTSKLIGLVPHDEFISLIKESDFVVTHGGAGTLRTLNSFGKPSICLPRLLRFGEHVNDHQVEIATEFQDRGITVLPDDFTDAEPSALRAFEKYSAASFQFRPLSDRDLADKIKIIVNEIIGY